MNADAFDFWGLHVEDLEFRWFLQLTYFVTFNSTIGTFVTTKNKKTKFLLHSRILSDKIK